MISKTLFGRYTEMYVNVEKKSFLHHAKRRKFTHFCEVPCYIHSHLLNEKERQHSHNHYTRCIRNCCVQPRCCLNFVSACNCAYNFSLHLHRWNQHANWLYSFRDIISCHRMFWGCSKLCGTHSSVVGWVPEAKYSSLINWRMEF